MQIVRMLVCIDGSTASLAASRVTIELARQWKCRLRAVYVVESSDRDEETAPDVLERLRESGGAILARVEAMAREAGVECEGVLLEGVPFDVILADARRWNADVIVMGRTGRTGPGRALLGSEAERVLEFADRPVLIVPASERGAAGPRPEGIKA